MAGEFDQDTFFNTTVDAKLDTKVIPVPEGEYTALSVKMATRSITTKDQDVRQLLEIFWELDDSTGAIKAITKRDKNTCKQTIWLDMTANGAALDYSAGMNIGLGRLREALKQNTPGAWRPSMLLQQVGRVMVKHRQEQDKNDPTDFTTYAEVVKVMPLTV